MIQRDIAKTPRKLLSLTMRDESGTLRTLKSLYMRDKSNVLRRIFASFQVSVSPASVSTTVKSNSTVAAATPTVALTIEGGSPPYVVAWAKTSGSADWAIDNPTGISTLFRIPVASGAVETGEFTATVTDDAGNTDSATVAATARNIGGLA